MSQRKTKKASQQKPARRSAYIALVSIFGALAVMYGIGSGTLPYSISMITCLKRPVTASNFAASDSYFLPGDVGYGPSPFNQYYCTEQQAQAAGFHRSVWAK